jgi:ubiquinone/menaquinone biosynthesis C-methylase UbiE
VLLDVGGNDGRLLHWFEARDRYVSVDPFLTVREDLLSPSRLSCYPSLAKPCNFLCGRVEYLPIQNSSIDFVWCASVLDQVWDPFGSLLEIHRVLKPGGRFFLATHIQKSTGENNSSYSWPKIARFSKEIIKKALGKNQGPQLWLPIYEADLLEIIELAGFDCVEKSYYKERRQLCLILKRA